MVQVGDTFKSVYADGMFTWEVKEIEGRFILADMWSEDWGEVEKAFLVTDVERAISYQQEDSKCS